MYNSLYIWGHKAHIPAKVNELFWPGQNLQNIKYRPYEPREYTEEPCTETGYTEFADHLYSTEVWFFLSARDFHNIYSVLVWPFFNGKWIWSNENKNHIKKMWNPILFLYLLSLPDFRIKENVTLLILLFTSVPCGQCTKQTAASNFFRSIQIFMYRINYIMCNI